MIKISKSIFTENYVTCNNMDDLKNIMLSERSQTQKTTSFLNPFLWSCRTGKTNLWSKKYRKTDCLGRWEGGEELGWASGLFLGGDKVLSLDKALGYTGVCTCQNSLNSTLKIGAFHCMFKREKNVILELVVTWVLKYLEGREMIFSTWKCIKN